MSVSPSAPGLEEMLGLARSHADELDDAGKDGDLFWDELRAFVPFGRQAFDMAVGLLAGPSSDRALACYLLSILCNPDTGGWSHDAALAVISAAEDESDTDVLWAMVHALSHAADPLGVPVLAKLRDHPDKDIRFQVAMSLPGCRSFEDGEDLGASADALLALMEDEDSDVRDWATFGIGTQLDVDGPTIRSALVARLEDEDEDTRSEAISGLARRRDPRAFGLVLEALSREFVPWWAIDAAGYLSDEGLLPILRELEADGTHDRSFLRDTIRLCDPGERVRDAAGVADLFALFEDPGLGDLRISASCDLFEKGWTTLFVQSSTAERHYAFDKLLDVRCGGDLSEVIRVLVSDARTQHEQPAGADGRE